MEHPGPVEINARRGRAGPSGGLDNREPLRESGLRSPGTAGEAVENPSFRVSFEVRPMPPAFPQISKIQYEGPKSRNALAFKHYHADEIVDGKPMKDHLRFSVVYWHTFRNPLADPFGVGTAQRPWDD